MSEEQTDRECPVCGGKAKRVGLNAGRCKCASGGACIMSFMQIQAVVWNAPRHYDGVIADLRARLAQAEAERNAARDLLTTERMAMQKEREAELVKLVDAEEWSQVLNRDNEQARAAIHRLESERDAAQAKLAEAERRAANAERDRDQWKADAHRMANERDAALARLGRYMSAARNVKVLLSDIDAARAESARRMGLLNESREILAQCETVWGCDCPYCDRNFGNAFDTHADGCRLRKHLDALRAIAAEVAAAGGGENSELCWAIMVNPDYVNGRGQWSRANQCGYTMDWRHAGRFSRQEAETTAAGSQGKYTAVPLANISERLYAEVAAADGAANLKGGQDGN